MSITVLHGDCRSVLPTLEAESVNCIVTSPPYFALRSYLPDGHPDKGSEIGLEQTPDAYVAELVEVFRECRRVLRYDGVAFLNLGDSYATTSRGASGADDKRYKQSTNVGSFLNWKGQLGDGVKPKDLIGIPWRVALALQADGWYLRADIIWHKPNPMPESVTDRPTKSREYVFMLTQSDRYWYDADAIAEEFVTAGSGVRGTSVLGKKRAPVATPIRDKRNARSVWTIVQQPFDGPHFATMPPLLVERCILAGCPVGGLVLDPFGGSGTTALVAGRLGRHATIIELNPEFAELARERVCFDTAQHVEISVA